MGVRHGQKLGWLRKWLHSYALRREHGTNFYSATHCTQYSDAIRSYKYKCVDKRQQLLCNCNLTLLRIKKLKGDEWESKSTATEIAYTVYASDSCLTMLFYRCFQWRCQCHRDNKSKAYGWLTFLLFRSSCRQHEVQAASFRDGGVLLFVCLYVCSRRRVLIVSILACYCVCCDLLLPSTTAGPFTTQWWRQFLVSLFTGNVGHAIAVYSALSATRVHSRQTRVHCRQRSVTDIPGE